MRQIQETDVSFITMFPIVEIATTAIGGLVAYTSLRDLLSTRRKSERLLQSLRELESWRNFEAHELSIILKDRRIDDAEWDKIISTIDQIVVSSEATRIPEIRNLYPTRSTKAKKLLISDAILGSRKEGRLLEST